MSKEYIILYVFISMFELAVADEDCQDYQFSFLLSAFSILDGEKMTNV